ncbi:purine-nucleoside phosphorylase [Saprospira grandis]|uniref:purine-nucleoside phosphorylase n=1 Tax=Saprospira grandis TaxID=1008 RepID=UPI0022DDC22C|nr:purine-nucleoside phosphorylase [Saprospira grandis]WBM73132.1 purine-nucleoside phosphorylase [Saprospira grandis]
MSLAQQIAVCHQYLNNRTETFKVRYGLILGTGLGPLAEEIEEVHRIPYAEIPHFPVSTVEGHAGCLIFGYLAGQPVVAMSGRFHYYEGYSTKEATFPIRIFKALGVERLLISSVVGSVNGEMNAGDIILVRDHINFIPDHPLRGKNDDRLGPRFPDMKDAYDHALNDRVEAKAKDMGLPIHQGVYLALQGPNLETPAEYRMAHILGADVIGMSTVPEVIVAKHAELPVLVTSIVSNKCWPLEEIVETSLEDVLGVVEKASPKLSALVQTLLEEEML